MTDCRLCEYKNSCVFANQRIQELNNYDNEIIEKDDNRYEINPYKIYDGCKDYKINNLLYNI